MATSNLISKSLGDILTESGTGTPDHISPKGSLYTDTSTGVLYQNVDGSTNWESFYTVSYGEVYFQGNTNATMYINGNATQTTVSVTNTWYSVRALSWSGTSSNGVTFSSGTNTMVVNSLSGGKYLVTGGGVFNRVTANAKYELGIAKNLISPSNGYYHGCSTDTTETNTYVNVFGYLELSPGDTVELGVRNTTTTNNVLLSDANISVYKIGNL